MNVLSIGNSFSQDAQRYLHDIAKAGGEDLTAINLYIGGCPLYKHFINMLNDSKSYALQFNGENTGFAVSIKDALTTREWDFITLQQASHESFKYDSYQPYLNELYAYVKKFAPKAKILMHQTWSYEQGSARLSEVAGYTEQAEMFSDIRDAYFKAADSINADGILPSGELLQKLLAAGISSVHRDALHTTLGLGRYAMGLLWYHIMTGNDIDDNSFCDFDEPVSAEEIAIAKKCVKAVAMEYANKF